MNRSDAKTTLINAIDHVAPNADPLAVEGDADLMEELDLDSVDLVGVVAWIHETTGLDIPERDYQDLYSFDSFVAYLTSRSDVETP